MEAAKTKQTLEFTPEIDRRIIEGFLHDKKAVIRELTEAGFSRKALRERAEKLGLTQSLLAQYQAGQVDLTVRLCLNCDEPFLSIGIFNRLCKRCRSRH